MEEQRKQKEKEEEEAVAVVAEEEEEIKRTMINRNQHPNKGLVFLNFNRIK